MLIRRGLIAAALSGCLAGCATGPLVITPPRVPQGGRALSIAVNLSNDKNLVVATETGGLFRTFDGGKSWQHLNLPNFKTIDVSFASSNPDVVIATAQSQYRTINDGGIWRSADGGGTWTQPPTATPPTGPGCPNRPGAFGISHMPLTRTFFVGTDCGLAVSNDDGVTWSHIVLDPTSLQRRIRSVMVINRTSGVAAGDAGVFFLNNAGMWTKSSTNPDASGVPVTHAFDSPFLSGVPSIFFHASAGQMLFLSTDGGANWSQVPAPSVNNREAFVRVARSLSNNDTQFDVYYGDGVKLHRQTFSFPGPTGSGTWTDLKSDHSDPSDIAFDAEHRTPILLASDGGVHRTTDQGSSWTLTGSGFDGFDALQISEVTGQSVTGSSPHLDLYYGTQDNDIKASSDGGHSWPGSVCCEGRFLRTPPTSVDHQGARITGTTCGACFNFMANPHLANSQGWPNAPGGGAEAPGDAPFEIVEDAYLQNAINPTMPPTFDYFLTLSAGAAWSKSFSLTLTPKGSSVFAGSPANPTVYQGVQRPGSLPNGGTRFGLMRVTNLAGQAVVTPVDTTGIGAFGSLRVPIARYVVFGVDPNNPNHLIAADAENNDMKFSADAGNSWHSLPQLTQAVTDNGKFLFELQELSLASVIAWDPFDSCHILVGTIENGVIRSTDGGNTWKQIDGSTAATFISSFYFPPSGAVWVSTNGRGLWNLNLDRQSGAKAGNCRFPAGPAGGVPVGPVVAINPTTGSAQPFSGLDDSVVCPRCSVVVVRNGWVTDVERSDDTVREIAISGGTISQVDRRGREIPLTIPNVYRPGDGKFEGQVWGRGVTGSGRVRALVLEGNQLRAVIAAGEDLRFAPQRTPLVYVFGAGKTGVPSVVQPDQPVRVIGTNFLPSSRQGQLVRILFDGNVVAQDVRVGADGSFSVELPVRHPPGELVVTVEQRDGRRLTIEKATIDVGTQDSL